MRLWLKIVWHAMRKRPLIAYVHFIGGLHVDNVSAPRVLIANCKFTGPPRKLSRIARMRRWLGRVIEGAKAKPEENKPERRGL